MSSIPAVNRLDEQGCQKQEATRQAYNLKEKWAFGSAVGSALVGLAAVIALVVVVALMVFSVPVPPFLPLGIGCVAIAGMAGVFGFDHLNNYYKSCANKGKEH